ncbi:hypothetical protein Phab24_id081 [Acinetobacter phage Phab24]|nr:hypothetical protein Phab24_id081 [Acinetobacter phage Phab24]
MSILERNDPNDATHYFPEGTSVTKYLKIDDTMYFFLSSDNEWRISLNSNEWFAKNLIELPKKQESEMKKDYANGEIIDAVDVPRLIKAGKKIQYRYKTDDNTRAWSDIYLITDEEDFTLGDLINSRYEWRIKPETADINLLKPKSIKVDPVTGAVGLFYGDNEVAREVAAYLASQFYEF